MITTAGERDRFDAAPLPYQVSDEALEAAAGTGAAPATTLIAGSYCLTCRPDDEPDR